MPALRALAWALLVGAAGAFVPPTWSVRAAERRCPCVLACATEWPSLGGGGGYHRMAGRVGAEYVPAITTLVTYEQVRSAVEAAEELWGRALAAREKADELSEEAERLSDEAVQKTEESTNQVATSSKFSLSMIGDARAAMDTSIEVQRLLGEAVKAATIADQLEVDAEAALQASEEALQQHLIDFPDSPEND